MCKPCAHMGTVLCTREHSCCVSVRVSTVLSVCIVISCVHFLRAVGRGRDMPVDSAT